MKKNLILLIISILLIGIIAGCTPKDKDSSQEENNDGNIIGEEINETDDHLDNDEDIVEDDNLELVINHNEYLSLAYEGKMDGIEFGVGDKGKDVIEQWGDPLDIDYFLGGLYMMYEDVTFFTNGYRKGDDTYDYGEVVIIYYGGENTTYNVKVGMVFEEIEEKLGEPSHISMFDENEYSELHGENWVAVYKTGEYFVSFQFPNENMPIEAIFIQKDK